MGWGLTLEALRRRWYVLVAGLLITAGLAYGAWQITPPTYVARGTQLLLPPPAQVDQGTHNPLLELGGLEAPAALVIAQLNGQEARESLFEHSAEAEYTVESDPALRGPTVMVTMGDVSPEAVMASLTLVLDSVPTILSDIQADLDVPSNATVTSMRLAIDIEPRTETSDTLRTVVIAVGAGLALTIVMVVGLDALLRRAKSRRLKQPRAERRKRTGIAGGGLQSGDEDPPTELDVTEDEVRGKLEPEASSKT